MTGLTRLRSRVIVRRLEGWLMVGALLFFAGAVASPIRTQLGIAGAPSTPLQMVDLILYLACGVLLLADREGLERALGGGLWIALLLAIAVASVTWSEAPAISVRRVGALVGTTVVGFYFASAFDLRGQLKILLRFVWAVLAISLVMVLLVPQFGLQHETTGVIALRGAMGTKNELGRLMALGVSLFVLTWLQRRRWRDVVGAALCLVALVLSRSVSAMAVLALVAAAAPLLRLLGWRYRHAAWVALFGAMIAATLVAWSYLSGALDLRALLASVGRDPTLTGRTPLWNAVAAMIAHKPWFGYGYNGFWLDWQGPSAIVWGEIHWMAYHAHDGYLDILLDLGFAGLALFALAYARAFVDAVRHVRSAAVSGVLAFWPVVFLVYAALSNVTEGFFLKQNSALWVVFVATSLGLAGQARPVRAAGPERSGRRETPNRAGMPAEPFGGSPERR